MTKPKRPEDLQKVGRKPIYDDPNVLLLDFIDYVDTCKDTENPKNNKLPNISGFCIYVNINPDTYYEMRKRPQFAETIKKIDAILEDEVVNNKNISDVMKIFYAKNKLGWTDKQELKADIDGKVKAKVRIEDLFDD